MSSIRLHFLVALLATATVHSLPLRAQVTLRTTSTDSTPVRQGEKVRVYKIETPAPVTGFYERTTGEGLFLMVPSADRRTQNQTIVPFDSIIRLSVERGVRSRGRSALRGAALGLLSGAALGAVVGYSRHNADKEKPGGTEQISWWVLRWAGVGTAIGAGVGCAWQSHTWVDVNRVR